jgi:uncharacterized protein YebE (UPF0316 family)
VGAAACLPLFIFVAEVFVVTIATMRTIFVARGMKVLAPVLGFFEVTTWLFAIGQVMQHLSDWTCSAAFAGGFTLGNYLGILLEGKLAMGSVVVRIITCRGASDFVGALRDAGYGVTSLDGQGSRGPVQVVLTVIRRKDLDRVLALVRRFEPNVFYAVDDLHAAARGVAPASGRGRRGLGPAWLRPALRGSGLPAAEGVTP